MKSNLKVKIVLVLLTFGIFFTLSSINFKNNSPGNSDKITLNDENLKTSKISNPIYINDNDPNYNWSVAEGAGICTGSGNSTHPYIIEDLIIDANGTGCCIQIENSDVYFRIENCTVYNSGASYPDAGILLTAVNNAQLISNNCSFNRYGIYFSSCNNIMISGNNVNYNSIGISLSSNYNTISGNNASFNAGGISLSSSEYNNISGNNVSYNDNYGISLYSSDNNDVLGNIVINNSDGISLEGFTSWCDDNNILGNTISYSSTGIYLHCGNGNTISQNTITENNYGIHIEREYYDHIEITIKVCEANNVISNNIFSGNSKDIYIHPPKPFLDEGTMALLIIILIAGVISGMVMINKKVFGDRVASRVEGRMFGITSLIFDIIGLIFIVVFINDLYMLTSLPFSILGIICGLVGYKLEMDYPNKKGLAILGLIIGAILLIVSTYPFWGLLFFIIGGVP